MNDTKIRRIVFGAVFTGSMIWITLILIAPYLRGSHPSFSAVIYASFSPVCHQVPSRCFYLAGVPLAVCSRCLGIYVGFFLGTLTYPKVRGFSTSSLPKIQTFFLLSGPIVLDTTGNFWGLWNTPAWFRFIFGVIWGILLPYYFITGLSELFIHLKRRKQVK